MKKHPLIDPIVEYHIKPKVMEGMRVEVIDKRTDPPKWESGHCTAVIAGLRPTETILIYRVVLDRRTRGRFDTKPITVTVHDRTCIRAEGEES